MYGPFHRKESPTQTFEIAQIQKRSGEIWGRPGRLNGLFPTVRAYKKPLCLGEPAGADCDDSDGIEFMAVARPSISPGGIAHWRMEDLPVEGLRREDDETIALAVTIYKIVHQGYLT